MNSLITIIVPVYNVEKCIFEESHTVRNKCCNVIRTNFYVETMYCNSLL